MSKIVASIEFENEVLKSDVPVVVDFFANWCGPCKQLAPALDEISGEMAGKAKVIKVDTDSSGDLAVAYNVKMLPTLLFFKNGEVADRIVGVTHKDSIVSKLNGLM